MSKFAVILLSSLSFLFPSFSLLAQSQNSSIVPSQNSAQTATGSRNQTSDNSTDKGVAQRSASHATVSTNPRALRASEVMALQAGGVLAASLVHEIQVRGINFAPDAEFIRLIKKAGADGSVVRALQTAKVVLGAGLPTDNHLLEQLADAAVLMKNKNYGEAGGKLSDALDVSFARFETGFVMAELLTESGDFEKAADVYAEILQTQPDFPEVHTKASFVLYKLGNPEDALNEAKTALEQNPNDAEAHKNRGLVYMDERKFDAAITEYQEALRLKPDYASVHYDIGLMYHNMHSYEQAIAEYKKGIAIDPGEESAHTNLGLAYKESGNLGGAIAELREAKRLNPDDPMIRQNLASTLMEQAPKEAIAELRELEQKFPNFEVCHVCLGNGLTWDGDLKGAEEEYRIAMKLAPEDPNPHVGMGDIQRKQKNLDGALEEYRIAEGLGSDEKAYEGAGQVLLQKKDYANAVAELKQAEMRAPSIAEIRAEYAKALAGNGQLDLAIGEFKEAIALDPKQGHVMSEWAAALEKKGDWFGAMEQYRKGALAQSQQFLKTQPGQEIEVWDIDPREEYRKAKGRFADHLVKLRAAGKLGEAADLEKRVALLDTESGSLEKVQAAMQEGMQALQERQLQKAEKLFNDAVSQAEKLPAADENLAVALGFLGRTYASESKFSDADAVLHREMTLTEKTWGSTSERMSDPLRSLAAIAMERGNFVEAEGYLRRVLDINLKLYGENNTQTAEALRGMGSVYKMQKQYDKAETYLLRAIKSSETTYGPESDWALIPLWSLCDLYDQWEKPAPAQPCWHRATEIMALEHGENSPLLASSLTNEAKALRKLGKNDEAERVEMRVNSLPKQTGQLQ